MSDDNHPILADRDCTTTTLACGGTPGHQPSAPKHYSLYVRTPTGDTMGVLLDGTIELSPDDPKTIVACCDALAVGLVTDYARRTTAAHADE